MHTNIIQIYYPLLDHPQHFLIDCIPSRNEGKAKRNMFTQYTGPFLIAVPMLQSYCLVTTLERGLILYAICLSYSNYWVLVKVLELANALLVHVARRRLYNITCYLVKK